jgi:hypothetical protein
MLHAVHLYAVLTLPLIHQGGSWFIEAACLPAIADKAVEAAFPQAFTRRAKTRLACSRVPHGTALVADERNEQAVRRVLRPYQTRQGLTLFLSLVLWSTRSCFYLQYFTAEPTSTIQRSRY